MYRAKPPVDTGDQGLFSFEGTTQQKKAHFGSSFFRTTKSYIIVNEILADCPQSTFKKLKGMHGNIDYKIFHSFLSTNSRTVLSANFVRFEFENNVEGV